MSTAAAAFWLVLAAQLAPGTGVENPEHDAIRKKIASERVRTRFLRSEESSILRGLRELERGVEAKKKKIAALEKRKAQIGAELARLDARLLENEAELQGLRVEAGRRAAAMLRLRRSGLVQLLERAAGPLAARKMQDRLRYVLAFDGRLIAQTRDASRQDRELRRSLEREQIAMEETQAELATESEEALVLKEDRAALLDAIRRERGVAERLGVELQGAARRLEDELGKVRGVEPAPEPVAGGFAAQKGRLPWPVTGRVEVGFGKKVDPESSMVMVQKGIDVRAPQSEPVRAVFGGRVAYAAWVDGYGRLLVLEHDGGHYSVYAHLESFAANVGQAVGQYAVVGFVGDSGSTKGAYLYFEIRAGREPQDPLRWLTR